jgi:hypothetical protein
MDDMLPLAFFDAFQVRMDYFHLQNFLKVAPYICPYLFNISEICRPINADRAFFSTWRQYLQQKFMSRNSGL